MSKNLMIGLAILLMFFIYALCFRKKNNHDRKRLSAEKIIEVINSIDHPAQKIAYLRKVDPYAFEELIMTLLQTNATAAMEAWMVGLSITGSCG